MPDSTPRPIAYDCRFFRGDRPCVWHKRDGLLCTCDRYDPIKERVLIIKLDAMGDVLRTTALLPALRDVHPHGAITWITRAESKPLLEQNPYISETLVYGPDTLVHLQARTFDRVINLDAGAISAALAASASGRRKDGYVLDERGVVQATNDAARRWLEMGVFDDLKRQGTRTYQSMMADILGIDDQPHHYVFDLDDGERARGREQLDRLGVDGRRPMLGLNTGAGGRWSLKQWRIDGYVDLIARMQGCAQIVLFGGPGERDRHDALKRLSRAPLIDAGCDNPVRQFGAMLAHADVVVTGDTLAMHLALALQRRTVVLFGPTSAPEIDLYGLGEKVLPAMSCLGCYKSTCDYVPNCMDLISVDMVAGAVERQMQIAMPQRQSA